MFSRRAASEFPNDNPELHDGLVWQSESVTGHALPTLRLRPPEGKLPKVLGPAWEERPKRVVMAPREEVRIIGRAPIVGRPGVVVSAPVVASSEVLGEAPVAGAAVPAPAVEAAPLVEPDPVESAAEGTSPSAFDALVAALVRVALDRGATRVAAELPELLTGGRVTPSVPDSARVRALVALGPAWRSALDGGDLSGCGDRPLDVWASEILATVLSAPGEREGLRRALRKHGVAAFGMLVAA